MGLRYSCSFTSVTVSAAQDLFELLVPTDAVVEILSARVGQQSDYGDAAAEGLDILIVVGKGATSGSGGAAGVEEPLGGVVAAGSVVEINNTTRMTAGGGSLHTLLADSFNIQVGWLYQPVPEERIFISPGNFFTLALPTAPTDPLEMSATIAWKEIGG